MNSLSLQLPLGGTAFPPLMSLFPQPILISSLGDRRRGTEGEIILLLLTGQRKGGRWGGGASFFWVIGPCYSAVLWKVPPLPRPVLLAQPLAPGSSISWCGTSVACHFSACLFLALPCPAAMACIFQVAKRGKMEEEVEQKGGERKGSWAVPFSSLNCFSRLLPQIALFAPQLVSGILKKKNKNRGALKRPEGSGNLSVPTSASSSVACGLFLTIPRAPGPTSYASKP